MFRLTVCLLSHKSLTKFHFTTLFLSLKCENDEILGSELIDMAENHKTFVN